MNKHNLDFQGMTFDQMKFEVIQRIKRMNENDAYELQEVVHDVIGVDVFWYEQLQRYQRDTGAYCGY